MKKIVFRTDSSFEIGSGHLMRCMTLAHQIKDKAEITFVCKDLTGNINNLVTQNGFKLSLLPKQIVSQQDDAKMTIDILNEKDIHCIVVDHYRLDILWQKQMQDVAKKIMVIDDLANRKHCCDILLDQNYVKNFAVRYDSLVPKDCKKFLGPKYVLLRDEFYKAREFIKSRDGNIDNVFVFFGSSDPTNETMKTLQALAGLKISVDVVFGANNPVKDKIEDVCKQQNYAYHCQIDYMTKLINKADLAIGAGGTTIWERCFLGLPTVVIAIADNQLQSCTACFEAGYIDYLGESANVSEQDIKSKVKYYLSNTEQLKIFADNCFSLFENYNDDYKKLHDSILEG